MRGKRPLLAEALTGQFTAHHAFLVRAMLDRIDAATAMEDRLCQQIDQAVRPFRRQLDLITTIPGANTRAAQVILAEIGADPARFPTAGDLASWAGMCPGNNRTGTH
jgi:transposase